jgi:hypothetical protein
MHVSKSVGAALLAGAAVLFAGQASPAAPLGATAKGVTITAPDATSPLVQVRSRRGAAVAAGIAGLIIGGYLAHEAERRGYGVYPYPYPYPYAPYPVYRPYPVYDPAIAYCLRRYRSYDPYTMTYLGYDGRRHPCP